MPHFPPPGLGGWGSSQSTSLLIQIGTELAQIPGHKNVLWFSGGPAAENFDPFVHATYRRRRLVHTPAPPTINLAQDVNLPPGDLYLYIAVWDTNTGRTGTLQIPFTAH